MLQGGLGTRPVLIAVTVVASLQLVFTYAPPMERLFDTRPIAFWDGTAIVAAGIALFVILEVEKRVVARVRLGARARHSLDVDGGAKIGRASCRARVCQYV